MVTDDEQRVGTELLRVVRLNNKLTLVSVGPTAVEKEYGGKARVLGKLVVISKLHAAVPVRRRIHEHTLEASPVQRHPEVCECDVVLALVRFRLVDPQG